MPANLQGHPLVRSSDITDVASLREALRALMFGGDEINRSTAAPVSRGMGGSNMIPWYEDLAEIDHTISEEVGVTPTPLPTSSLLEKLDDMAGKLESWYAVSLPVYQKRLMHHAYDEVVEVAGMLRGGQINAGEADRRFGAIMAEVGEVYDFSRYAE